MLKILILVVTSSDIDRVFSCVAPLDVSSNCNSWPRRKDLQFLSFQFANFFFAVRSVCLCRRKSWTREATLMYYLAGRYPSKLNCAVFIIFLFATAYVHCLIFLPGQLTPRKRKHKQNFKTSWKSELGFSLRLKPFDEG